MNTTQQSEQVAAKEQPSSRLKMLLPATLIALPAIFFYGFLLKSSLDLPFFDDYDSVLDFIAHIQRIDGFSSKLIYLLTVQHNEYKLVLAHTIAWVQFLLLGHINFQVLSAIGNIFVLLLAVQLWKMFCPACKKPAMRLALFVPVPYILFQFEYYETLNWGLDGLQVFPVLCFAFASICLLLHQSRRAFLGSLACLVMAIASSGNGFLMIPIGALLLLMRREFSRTAVWLAVSAASIAMYAYKYDVMWSRAAKNQSLFATITHLKPLYVIAFMGDAAGIPYLAGSIVLGSALCILFVWMAFRGYFRKNPAASLCILFLFLTSLGVAGIRSDLGIEQSSASRYTIHSALLLIFAWFAIAEEFLQDRKTPLLASGLYLSAVSIALVFGLFNSALGAVMILKRNDELIRGMRSYEHLNRPDPTATQDGPMPNHNAWVAGFNLRARGILQESSQLKIYDPPRY